MTPLTCWKTAWTPQKHPPEITAVCCPEAPARGASNTGGGTVTDGPACAFQIKTPNSDTTTIRRMRVVDDILVSSYLVRNTLLRTSGLGIGVASGAKVSLSGN